jgi:Ca2+-binding EF-hand superfamily protein
LQPIPSSSRYHSADTNQDGAISLTELTRVIELYNYRSGTTRTGEYRTQAGTEDGYAPGPGSVSPFHSADTNRDGAIGLTELTRIIELYNYRSGTTRTGQYRAQAGTEDGFAPGP